MVINALLRISPTLSNFFQNNGSSLSDKYPGALPGLVAFDIVTGVDLDAADLFPDRPGKKMPTRWP